MLLRSPSFHASLRRCFWGIAAALCTALLCLARPANAEKWALLIGIDAYSDSNRISSLGSAAADARALKKVLIEADGFPEANVCLLISDSDASDQSHTSGGEEKPLRTVILRELSRLAKNARPGDTVFFLFSGHGIEKEDRSYLLPYDANASDSEMITDTAIDTVKLRERLQSIHASLLLLAFDMCRDNPLKGSRDIAGLATDSDNTLKSGQVRSLDFSGIAASGGTSPATQASGPRTVVTLFSCRADERSYEWIDKGRGYFSYFLEQGLRGAKGAADAAGVVRVNTLITYLTENVTATVEREEGGKSQTPFAEVKGESDAGHLAIAQPDPLSAAAETSLPLPIAANDRKGYLTVAVTPADATILVDGLPEKPVGGRIAIDMGTAATRTVEVGVLASGFQTNIQSVTVQRGVSVPFIVTLGKAAVALPPPEAGAPSRTFVNIATKHKTNPKDGAEMVFVPAGSFPMGDDDNPNIRDNPRHTVTLSGYYVYKNLVTVAMYRKYCAQTKRKMPSAPPWGWRDEHPIVHVSWLDAAAYCDWAGVRLPTEAEWEKAARGPEGRKFPWGDDWNPSLACTSGGHHQSAGSTRPVGSYPAGASPYGLLDMAGNVYEWCADFRAVDFWVSGRAPALNPVNHVPTPRSYRVLRGGSWGEVGQSPFRTAARYSHAQTDAGNDNGFRCAVSSGT